MTPLKKFKTKFWGQECVCRPMLLDHVFGDGKERVWIEHMDDRPDYYVVRVPTGTHEAIDKRTDAWYDLLPDILQQIEDEAMDFYSERQWREHDTKGYVSATRKWPIPPSSPSGTAWGEMRKAVDEAPEPKTRKEQREADKQRDST